MTREERDLDGIVVHGSDNLTAYNLYAEAFREAGYLGEVYGLPRHLFDAEKVERWAERSIGWCSNPLAHRSSLRPRRPEPNGSALQGR